MPELEYTDHRSRKFFLKSGQVTLPRKSEDVKVDQIVTVTDTEKKCLLGMRNGKKPCFKEILKRIARKATAEEE